MDNSQGRYDSLNLSSKTILITGAAGFIGSNLVEYFATHHPKCRILALDCFGDSSGVDSGLALGHFENLTLYPNVEVFPLDITSMQDLKSLYRHGRIDYIFHEAAISDTTCKYSRRVMEVNLLVFKNLVKLAMKYHSHIIYASSAATYGNSEIPHKIGVESADSIYAYSKLCMDRENRRNYLEKALALCAEFGGSSIYIPKQETLNRELRNKDILEEYKNGVSLHQLRKK